MSAPKTVVYFIATMDRSKVKIGWSYQAEHRLMMLLGTSPFPLVIAARVPGSREDERALHTAFIDSHSHREWFNGSPELSALIDFVNEHGELPLHYRGKPGQTSPLWKRGPRAGVKRTPTKSDPEGRRA